MRSIVEAVQANWEEGVEPVVVRCLRDSEVNEGRDSGLAYGEAVDSGIRSKPLEPALRVVRAGTAPACAGSRSPPAHPPLVNDSSAAYVCRALVCDSLAPNASGLARKLTN